MKSHPKPVVNSESNSKSVKSYKRFRLIKYHNNQKCIDCFKPRLNKNELVCKKCGCDYFYVPNY